MASKREQIRMSDEEVLSFIREQKNIQVATINADGTPHLTTLWFAIVDDKIVLETFSKSQKVKNLERDRRVTVLLEDGDVYEKLRGVCIYAEADLRNDVEEVHRLHVEVLKRNNDHGLDEEMMVRISKDMAPKKTAIIIVPKKIVSWDHTKLGGAY